MRRFPTMNYRRDCRLSQMVELSLSIDYRVPVPNQRGPSAVPLVGTYFPSAAVLGFYNLQASAGRRGPNIQVLHLALGWPRNLEMCPATYPRLHRQFVGNLGSSIIPHNRLLHNDLMSSSLVMTTFLS